MRRRRRPARSHEPAGRAGASGVDDLAGFPLQPGTARFREVTARARQWLSEARVAAQNVLTVLEFEPLHQAMAIEALAPTSNGSARYRPAGRRAPRPRASGSMPSSRGCAACWASPRAAIPTSWTIRSAPVASRCRRCCWARDRRELAWPMQDVGPDALWAHRFLLSRLQAHVAALDQTPDGERAPRRSAWASPSGPADWLEALGRRRDELADAADERTAAMAPAIVASPAPAPSPPHSTRLAR